MPAATRTSAARRRGDSGSFRSAAPKATPKSGVEENEGREQRSRVVADQREPRDIGDRRHPDRLVEERRQDGDGKPRVDMLADQGEDSASPSTADTASW